MKPLHMALGASLALALSAQAAAPAQAAPRRHHDERSRVDPAALQALQRMSAYLGTLTSFEIRSAGSLELVLDNGQKIELDSVNTYRVHRPDGFMIETASDERLRRFFYNGKQFTVFAPELGYYATVPAPPTIRQTLDVAADKYGVELPLEDLFRWSEPGNDHAKRLRDGMVVGTATLDGVKTDQYAFREGDIDWQIWISQGAQPLPVKVVITDRADPAHPAFTARLAWNTKPTLAANAFTFTPGAGAKPIHIAQNGR